MEHLVMHDYAFSYIGHGPWDVHIIEKQQKYWFIHYYPAMSLFSRRLWFFCVIDIWNTWWLAYGTQHLSLIWFQNTNITSNKWFLMVVLLSRHLVSKFNETCIIFWINKGLTIYFDFYVTDFPKGTNVFQVLIDCQA